MVTLREMAKMERGNACAMIRVVMTGGRLRYARKALGLTQVRLGELLGYAGETVSRWENDQAEVPPVVRLAMIGLLTYPPLGAA
jgi:transcriptional regulator with XRE-family HTH domain